jgi:hypothetical protein
MGLPAPSYLTGARRRVPRTRSACIWSRFWQRYLAAGALGPSCTGLEHLISAVRGLSAQPMSFKRPSGDRST